jgi:hypothetical protein
MAASPKPPTSLKISIAAFGSAEQRLDLFAQLEALGYLERSQDIVLNVGYYFEEDGRIARDKAETLLRDHPAVLKTKSFTDLGTKRKVSDTFEAEAEADEEDDETPLEAWERQQAERIEASGVGSVTLTHRSPGQSDRVVELTPETRKRAEEALHRSAGE